MTPNEPRPPTCIPRSLKTKAAGKFHKGTTGGTYNSTVDGKISAGNVFGRNDAVVDTGCPLLKLRTAGGWVRQGIIKFLAELRLGRNLRSWSVSVYAYPLCGILCNRRDSMKDTRQTFVPSKIPVQEDEYPVASRMRSALTVPPSVNKTFPSGLKPCTRAGATTSIFPPLTRA